MKALLSIALLVAVTACSNIKGTLPSYVVYFDTDKYSLDSEARSTLSKVAEQIKAGSFGGGAPWKHDNCHTKVSLACESRGASLTVIGHTDTQGNEAYNQLLSQNRAETVSEALVKNGVEKSIIKASGRGESSPAVATGDNKKEAKNRRVEIFIY